jgi:sarcosine oxidase
MSSEHVPEIAVVGAGVIGLATARALAQAGHDVVVYEQFELDHERGSSHGRSRIFRLAYPDPNWVRLAIEEKAGAREIEAESGQVLLSLTGLLELVGDPAQSSQAGLEDCGVEWEVLGAEEAERRFGVSPGEGSIVLFQPEAGIVYADRARQAFARDLRIEEGHRVESLDDVEAEAVVVTAGPWARRLLATAGIELPVVETRETVAYFRLEDEIPSVVEVVNHAHGFYSLTDPLYGLKVGSHMKGLRADPDEDGVPDEPTVLAIADWTAARFRLADPEPVHAESCFYTTTDDERFLLERHGRIVVGSACSGHGFKFAPAVGKRLAALAAEALG